MCLYTGKGILAPLYYLTRFVGNSGGAQRERSHCLRELPVTGNNRETRGRPFSASRVAPRYRETRARPFSASRAAPRYRQQQGDTRPSVLREPCRSRLQATTGRHAVRSPRAVSIPSKGNNTRDKTRKWKKSRIEMVKFCFVLEISKRHFYP